MRSDCKHKAKCGKESLYYCRKTCREKTRESGIPKHDDTCPYGNLPLEEAYDKEVVELLEEYGWVICESDEPDYRAWFAYYDLCSEEVDHPDWTNGVGPNEVYEWLISAEGVEWRKNVDALIRKSVSRSG